MRALDPRVLYRRCDPAQFGFVTTAELPDAADIVGQPRAVAALAFGLGIAHPGYNIFALGVPGTGKQTFVIDSLRAHAGGRPVPPDLCYIHNFDEVEKPRLLEVPAGTGAALRRDLEQLVDDLRTAIAGALEREDYQSRREAVEKEFKERPQRAVAELGERAQREGLALVQTPHGFMVAAQRHGEVLTGERFESLPEDERKVLQARIEAFEADVERTLRQLPRWVRERRERLQALRREATELAVGHLMDEVRARYATLPTVVEHLDRIRRDVIDHAEDLLEPEGPLAELLPEALVRAGAAAGVGGKSTALRRYRVNVLVSHEGEQGAPVVFEDHPTYDNLVGRIEHAAQFGALVTNFLLIRAGALHRASGGYLVLEAHKLLHSPYAWDALKRALRSRRLRIEPLGQALGLVGTVSLEPEPTPLDVQVVLVGDPLTYYLLCALDPDFTELFKVAADFDDEMNATDETRRQYARLLATLTRRQGLRPLHRGAVARVIEHSARLAGHQEKLSLRIGDLVDLLREAGFWAARAGADAVTAAHVQQAIDARIARADRLRGHLYDEVARGTIMIDTAGRRVGQVNSVSVVPLGGFAFGRPNRITARMRLGQAGVVDIEREVQLGGPLHSKGVLILGAYLGARYASDRPLSLSGSVVFEQSYGAVEGDSASAAELFALLSAVADVPLAQSLAVTGSVNQHGEVQAVGGVNEKIEGFFDICRARGLTGEHGVIIPAANVQHLMLRQDVVDAVTEGRFHVYAIKTADEGIELLTGMPAGERTATGEFSDGSFNRAVEERLRELAGAIQAYGAAAAVLAAQERL